MSNKKQAPPLFPRPAMHEEPMFLWNVRLSFQPTVHVFGKPICSQCGNTLLHHEAKNPQGKSRMMEVWSCPKKGCHLNQKVRLKPCCNCEVKDGRFLIDSRFNRAMANQAIWGPWIACRICGQYGDPQGLTSITFDNDVLLKEVFK